MLRTVLTSEELLSAYDSHQPVECLAPTSLVELDAITGGMAPGRVWIVLSTPGQGRTTLMTQWAASVAQHSDQVVHLVTPRESPTTVVARLLSLTGRLPLHHLTSRTLSANQAPGLERAREQVAKMSLCLYARGEDVYVPEIHPTRAALQPKAIVVDDADLVSGLTPSAAAEWARLGIFVLLSLPRHHVLQEPKGDPDIDPAWARAADVVLEVRHRGLPVSTWRPGEADVDVHYNRHGYARTLNAGHQAHYSRFIDPGE